MYLYAISTLFVGFDFSSDTNWFIGWTIFRRNEHGVNRSSVDIRSYQYQIENGSNPRPGMTSLQGMNLLISPDHRNYVFTAFFAFAESDLANLTKIPTDIKLFCFIRIHEVARCLW